MEQGESASAPHHRHARRTRWGTLLLVVLFHALAFTGLVHAFAPDLSRSAIQSAAAMVSVDIAPPPEPEPEAMPSPDPQPVPDEGAAAEEGPRETPREVVAPPVQVPITRPVPAPRAASTGDANLSGAQDAGQGTGAGGQGDGTGAGRSGRGTGGIPVTRPEKVAGDINSAEDYPTPPGGRQIRWGHEVIVHMTVGVDGRASDCRVARPSPDAEADRITCRLAEERFRFRPARDANGDAVPATYGWRQWWRPAG